MIIENKDFLIFYLILGELTIFFFTTDEFK